MKGRQRALTDEQITLARELKNNGKSNREIAKIFEVGKTTIWENVYSTTKRTRTIIYRKRVLYPRDHCVRCEIGMTKEVSTTTIPLNFQIGDKCLNCYLELHGQHYIDLLNI